MTLWNGKKYIKVFQPTEQCRLSLSDILVYSYYAYQDAFDTTPGTMQIVRGVGLSKNTVSKVRDRLKQHDLYLEDKIQPPPEGLFYPANRKKISHWRDNYAYWHYYIRSPDSSLTTLQVAVLSLLWHLHQTHPGAKLSISYLALLLCAKRESISTALQSLESEGLLTYKTSKKKRAGLKVSLRPLTPYDMRHFQDIGGEITADQIEDLPNTDPLASLNNELVRILVSEKHVEKIERAILATPVWATDKASILRYCQHCPTSDDGVMQLVDKIILGWQIGLAG